MTISNNLPRFLPRRPLGKTRFPVTAVGLGDVADRSLDKDVQVSLLRRGLDAGINLLDTAPGYEDGFSEEIVGEVLKGHDRDSVFLIDKIDFLDQPVEEQVYTSLERLGQERIDAMVFHAVSSWNQWDALVEPEGPFHQLEQCICRGQVRWRGISSHDPVTLKVAILSGYCDIVMFPIGPAVDPRYITEVLPLARLYNIGTVCFKTFGAGKLLGDTLGYNRPLRQRPRGKFGSGGVDIAEPPELPHLDVETCVRYTMTIDPDVALLGMSAENEQDAALAAAASFTPYTEAEMEDVTRRAAEAIRGKGGRHWDPVVGD